jgi:mRNA interferase MazF
VVSQELIRGQVWTYALGSRQYRVLIVSNDEYTEDPGIHPLALTISRQTPDLGTLTPIMSADDPLSGARVLIPHPVRIDRTALRDCHGFVSNATMRAVEHGLRDYLVLP